jgi:hypothetical protein
MPILFVGPMMPVGMGGGDNSYMGGGDPRDPGGYNLPLVGGGAVNMRKGILLSYTYRICPSLFEKEAVSILYCVP